VRLRFSFSAAKSPTARAIFLQRAATSQRAAEFPRGRCNIPARTELSHGLVNGRTARRRIRATARFDHPLRRKQTPLEIVVARGLVGRAVGLMRSVPERVS
jgi:hypothetical protein